MSCSFYEFIFISIDLHLFLEKPIKFYVFVLIISFDLHLFLEKPRKSYVIVLVSVSVWLCLMMVDEMMDIGINQDCDRPVVSVGYVV